MAMIAAVIAAAEGAGANPAPRLTAEQAAAGTDPVSHGRGGKAGSAGNQIGKQDQGWVVAAVE
ncbi:hypothetical protein D3879_06785 [Pseudomonas cavernicola]|uniref:Uncharacterized protein n=1 Tax=Pseudomonas cavernicola TaxID=2320866 RepID=A0A418XKJ1_9PSED|nr:hypothetical protein [Pseudomonas cavernicola]RJG12977.1 hypothetical protein D3879_06785 [Pseudomonas cavernicola]